MMPVLNGAELCRRLKGSLEMRSIPVILMRSAGRRSADGAGSDAFLDKTFHLEDLEALVRRWLSAQNPRPPGQGCQSEHLLPQLQEIVKSVRRQAVSSVLYCLP